MKAHKIKIPIYEYELVVIFGPIKKKDRPVLKKLLPPGGTKALFDEVLDNNYWAITTRKGKTFVLHFKDKADPNTIAHESFHVVEILMGCIGAKLGVKSSENWSYFLGWIVEQVHKLKKKK